MTILRLRVEVADERGRLGRVASVIAACGGNILGVDVHFLDGTRVADEFILEFTEGASGEALANALRRAGGVTVEVERLDEHALVDPVARAIDIGARVSERGLEACAAQLVRADRARLLDSPAARESNLIRDAAEQGAPVVGRERALTPAEDGDELPWVLVLADDGGPRPRWLVVERRGPAFSSSEAARVASLLRLARAADEDARALAERARISMGPAGPVSRRPATFFRRTPAVAAA